VFLLGIKHPAPLNDVSRLDKRTMVLGLVGFVVLAATFVPQPMVTIAPDHAFEMNVLGGNNTTVAAGGAVEFTVLVNNTGNTDSQVRITIDQIPGNWTASLFLTTGTSTDATNALEFALPFESTTSVTVLVHVPADATSRNLSLVANASGVQDTEVLTVTVA
jgi:uncharacterized repeat protein (TIGR01451 family)